MSDLYGNHIVGFPTRRLINEIIINIFEYKFVDVRDI